MSEKARKHAKPKPFFSKMLLFNVRKGEPSTFLGYTRDTKLVNISNTSHYGKDYIEVRGYVNRFYSNFRYVMTCRGFTLAKMSEWIRLKTGVRFSRARLQDLINKYNYVGSNSIEFMIALASFCSMDFIEMLSVDYTVHPPEGLPAFEHGKDVAAKTSRYNGGKKRGERKPAKIDYFINPHSLKTLRRDELKSLKCCPACGRSVASEGEAVYLSELVMEMDFQDPNWRLTADEIIENDILKKADAIRKKRGLPAK